MRVAPSSAAMSQSEACALMEEFVKKMQTRLQKVNIDYPPEHVQHEPDPYLQLPFNQHPDFMAFDSFMYPVVVLCTMLSSAAETALLTAQFSAGLRVETGCLHTGLDVKGLDKAIHALKERFRRAVVAIERSFPRAVIAATPVLMVPLRRSSIMSIAGTSAKSTASAALGRSAPAEAAFAGGDSLALNKSMSIDQLPQQPAAAAAAAASLDANPYDSSFVARAQAGTKGMFAFGQYSTAYSSAVDASTAGAGSQFSDKVPPETDIPDLSVVKDHAIGYGLLSEMKKADIPTEPIASSALIRLRDEYGVEVVQETGLIKEVQLQLPPLIKEVEVPAQVVAASEKKRTRKSKDETKTAAAAAAAAAAAEAAAAAANTVDDVDKDDPSGVENYKYVPAKHDLGTIHAEILPLLDHFGRNEISAWIQWAVSTCGGASMAILGQNCSNPREKVGLNWNMMVEEQPSVQLLREVRKRLLEVESKVTATPTNAKAHLDHKHVNIETRVLIYLLLTKISAQIGEHKETGHFLYQLERICEELRDFQARSTDSLYYTAIAIRMRMDYEEWSVPDLVSDGWILTFYVNKQLPLAKKYLKCCEELSDVIMQRDALKRMMNIYLEVSSIPLSEDHDEKSQTLSQLGDVSESVVEENEANNPEWLQKNGHLRATACLHKMQQLGKAQFAD